MKRGFTAPAAEMIQWIGLILICIIMLYVIINWAAAGAHVQRGVEQGSLMYTIASSVNALSSMEEGEVARHLTSPYDITVECDGSCSVTTAAYDRSGNRQKESNEVLVLGEIKPVRLESVNSITLTKEGDGSVVLTGERTEDVHRAQLNIPDIDPKCIAQYKDPIKSASDKYGVEQELIAAVTEAESSWNPDSYRYEPAFQMNLEGESQWTGDDAWLGEGDTIRQWFDKNPRRKKDEFDNFVQKYPDKLDIVAQVRVSASYGLMQTLYTTAHDFCGYRGEPEGLQDPATNIDCGTKYLKDMLYRYGNDKADAVSAYNAGSRAWETNPANRRYTENVLGNYHAFRKCAA